MSVVKTIPDIFANVVLGGSFHAFEQVDNGIPIQTWIVGDEDKELLLVLPFLESLKDCDDVRPAIRSHFGIQEYIDGLYND